MTLLDASDIGVMHDTLIELSNATLTTVETPGTLGRNGDPGVPVTAWTGSAPGFLLHEEKDILSQGVEVSEPKTTFRLFDQAGADVSRMFSGADWSASTVVIADHRLATTSTRRWTIIAMEHEQDGTLDSVLLTLNADTTVA